MFPRAAEGLKECKKILKDLKRAHGAFFWTSDQAIGGRLGGPAFGVDASSLSCGFCLWLSLAWDCLVLIGFDGWWCFFPFVAVPGA